MLGPAEVHQLMQVLWPRGDATPGSLWAILDCARDRRILGRLEVARLDHQCLYSGPLHPELRRVAPTMVELNPRHGFTRQMLEEGFGRSWGIFARVGDWTRLRHHLRKLLTVTDESGRKLLFRYYDPRVLRRFLPTCTSAELQQMFGPVTSLLAEADGPEPAVISFELDGPRLLSRTIPLRRP